MVDRAHAYVRAVCATVRPARSVAPEDAVALTPRQHAVMARVMDGATDAQAAETLEVSRRTVQYDVRTMLERFGVKSRVALGTAYSRALLC